MTYLSYIIALVQFLSQGGGEDMTLYQGLDIYLDMVVPIELLILRISLGGLALAFVLFIVMLLVGKEVGRTCGCYLLILGVIWPIGEYITYLLTVQLASSVDPTGIVNATKFWLIVIVLFIIGAS